MIVFVEGPDVQGKQDILNAAHNAFKRDAYYYECVKSAQLTLPGKRTVHEQLIDSMGRVMTIIDLASNNFNDIPIFISGGLIDIGAESIMNNGGSEIDSVCDLIADPLFNNVYISVVMQNPSNKGEADSYKATSIAYRTVISKCMSLILDRNKNNKYKFLISGNSKCDYVANFILEARNLVYSSDMNK